MPRRNQTRRRFLRNGGILGTLGLTGCLRLTGGNDSTPSDQQTATRTRPGPSNANETEPTASTPSDSESGTPTQTFSGSVELTTRKTLEDRYIEDMVTHAGEFYFEDKNVVRMTAEGETVWTSPKIYEPDTYYSSGASDFSANTVFWGIQASDEASEPLGGKVVALEKATGKKRWEFAVEADGMHHDIESLSVVNDLLAVGSDDSGTGDEQEPLVYGLDPATGEQRWRTGDFPAGFIETVFEYDGAPHVVMLDGIYRCDPTNGKVTTVSDVFSGFGGAAVVDGVLYLPGNPFRSFDLASETVRWETKISGDVKTRPVVGNGRVFAGTDTGFVYAFDTSNGGKLWETRALAQVVDLEVTSNLLWVTDEIGSLYAYTRQNGEKVYEKKSEKRDQRSLATVDDTILLNRPSSLVKVVSN